MSKVRMIATFKVKATGMQNATGNNPTREVSVDC